MPIRSYYQKNKEKCLARQKIYVNTYRGRYTDLKKNAKYRNKEFSLTLEECLKLWGNECYYCGLSDNKMGIDRVNSRVGYIISNVVTCCSTCNYMKNEMNIDGFIERCSLILNNYFTKQA